MSTNKQTVERYMEAYSRHDHEAILACLTEDVEWVVPGAFHHHGKQAFDAEIENGADGPPEITITRLTEENGIVIAEGTVHNRMADGTDLDLVYCDVFEMANGLVRKLTSYLMVVPAPSA